MYFWIVSDDSKRLEAGRQASCPLPHVKMGPFITYFPTYLKFHELFRLGAYCHPFDLIDEFYRRDQGTHSDYTVKGDSWDTAFEDLKTFEDGPFAFLSPAMQEGSALAGPFLPIDWTLHEVHHYMGLAQFGVSDYLECPQRFAMNMAKLISDSLPTPTTGTLSFHMHSASLFSPSRLSRVSTLHQTSPVA